MKNLSLVFASFILASSAFADYAEPQNLTLAVADIKSNTVWIETFEDVQLRINEELSEKAELLNDKIGEKLQQQIERKVAQDLGL